MGEHRHRWALRALLFALLAGALVAAVICCALLWLGTLECLDQCGAESVPEWMAAGVSTVAVGALAWGAVAAWRLAWAVAVACTSVAAGVPYLVVFGVFS